MAWSDLPKVVLTNWVPALFPAAAVAFVGVYGARRLEEYRRRQSLAQAMATEQGKAMVWVSRALGRVYLRARLCLLADEGHPDRDARKKALDEAAEFAVERLHSSAVVLLPKDVDEIAGRHMVLVSNILNDTTATSAEKEGRLRAGLSQLRTDLQQLLTDLWK